MGTGVDIALDASEIEGLDQEALQARYEEAADAISGADGNAAQEDLSDMVAQHAAAQTRKRKSAAPTPAPKRRLNK
ncbi:Splicing factor 3B subunit 2 [Coemansia furcata]|uniref:Splicing factor 3B subunit 2 n=1 Tax=Coemansia furcata TaxID=417177 RepID=A0ACC1L031_9FUNG|nr:Splicing factor 3B subunit 2 [Coemansia furcata]